MISQTSRVISNGFVARALSNGGMHNLLAWEAGLRPAVIFPFFIVLRMWLDANQKHSELARVVYI